MKLSVRTIAASTLLALCLLAGLAPAQQAAPQPAQGGAPVVLAGAELTRVVPPGFYFEGQSAPTQARNSAAARFGKKHVIAGLVDTTGYSSEIRAKYEGFLIADAAINVGTGALPAGAYGFGFTEGGQFNVFDVGGSPLISVEAPNDAALARPRPLMMTVERDGLRLYGGRRYVVIGIRQPEVEL
ncbi:MAG TPA: hypothetical protein VFS10_23170 [Pyrinomonadaceae bacterium]|nr:hypothetical protein [Pyrinomonadaceae bacterium]